MGTVLEPKFSKAIKTNVDDKTKYTEWNNKEDIKAELKMDIIVKLAEFRYPPVAMEVVYKNVLEPAENFKRNRR